MAGVVDELSEVSHLSIVFISFVYSFSSCIIMYIVTGIMFIDLPHYIYYLHKLGNKYTIK